MEVRNRVYVPSMKSKFEVSLGSLKCEVRMLKWEVGKSGSREVGSRKSEVESRKSEVGSRKSEVGSRKSEVGSRKSEVPPRFSYGSELAFIRVLRLGLGNARAVSAFN